MRVRRTSVVISVAALCGLAVALSYMLASADPTTAPGTDLKPISTQPETQPTWRTVSVDANQKPLEDVVAEIARQSGVPTAVDGFPWHADKVSPKVPITVKLDKKPYWEAMVAVSQLANLGLNTSDPSCVEVSGSARRTSQYRQFGPLTIALVPTVGTEEEQELEFGLRVFYLKDEVLEGEETYFRKRGGAFHGWPVKIESGDQAKNIMAHYGTLDYHQFSLPEEFRGKKVTLSGLLSYIAMRPSGKLLLELKPGAVATADGITIRMNKVTRKDDKTVAEFDTSWAAGLPQETLDQYERIAKSPTAPTPEDIAFIDDLKQKARRVQVRVTGIDDRDGKTSDDAITGRYIRDHFIRGSGEVTMKGSPDGRKLRIETSRIEPGAAARAEFRFADVVLGKN